MNEVVTVMALIRAKKGKEKKVRKELEALLVPTRSEEGCINYDLHQSLDEPALFLFYENWRSREALDRHLQMPYIQDFLKRTEELLTNPPEIRLFRRL